MNKNSLALTAVLLVGLGGILFWQPQGSTNPAGSAEQNVEVRDGVQYVIIFARGGYSPRESTAQAGLPTKLLVKTDGTYDCSAALTIRSLGFKKILPSTGEETIDLGTPTPGTLQGICSMGMFSFAVNFQ